MTAFDIFGLVCMAVIFVSIFAGGLMILVQLWRESDTITQRVGVGIGMLVLTATVTLSLGCIAHDAFAKPNLVLERP